MSENHSTNQSRCPECRAEDDSDSQRISSNFNRLLAQEDTVALRGGDAFDPYRAFHKKVTLTAGERGLVRRQRR